MNKQKIAGFIGKSVDTALSLARLACSLRLPSVRLPVRPYDSIVILGNGPSLRTTLASDSGQLGRMKTMGVNFAANTPVFRQIKPAYYVLADPHFFNGRDSDPNVEALWRNIADADWALTLFIPYERLGGIRKSGLSPNIRLRGFPMTPVEGFAPVCHAAFSAGLGTPRPRNVLIPSIMCAIREGFGTIYIAGADHSWTKTLDVDEENRVVSLQPHFYEDNEHEKKRVVTEYHNYPLHTILKSLYTAFRSYFHIRDYAGSLGVKIINITPGSFIDAFERGTLPGVSGAR